MYSLFIDTHSSLITISFINEKKEIIKTKESEKSHSVYLLPLIKSVMEENDIKMEEIKEILVINGPGSFTGIRVGLSVAKTFSYALNIPIKVLSSLMMYYISSNEKNKMVVIKDSKGYYYKTKDEESYTNNINILENDYKVIENKINIRKVYNYFKDINSLDVHLVKANYIKKIEAEK